MYLRIYIEKIYRFKIIARVVRSRLFRRHFEIQLLRRPAPSESFDQGLRSETHSGIFDVSFSPSFSANVERRQTDAQVAFPNAIQPGKKTEDVRAHTFVRYRSFIHGGVASSAIPPSLYILGMFAFRY